MRIKCKNCGKRFDTAMYSGLCPKCGTYHRMEEEGSLTLQQLKSEPTGEEAHKLLHGKYDSLGADYVRWHDGMDEDEAFDEEDYEENDKKVGRHPKPVFRIVLIVLILLVPFLSFFYYQGWKTNFLKSRILEKGEITEVVPNQNTLVFEGEQIEYPTMVTVTGAGEAVSDKLPKGMKFWAVKASAFSEGYSYKRRIRGIYLCYEDGKEHFYREPLTRYDVRGYLPDLGLKEEDLLSDDSVGVTGEEEGYWFFMVEESVQNPGLVLTVENKEEPEQVLMMGRIDLSGFAEESLSFGKEEQK